MKSVNTLSVVWYCLGALQMLAALLFGTMFTGMGVAVGLGGGDDEAAVVGGIFAVLGVFLGVFIAITTIPAFLTGWGLGKRKGWARLLAMVLGAFQLLSFPIGTLIGVWTIWLLVQPDVEAEFRDGAPSAG